MRVQAHTIEELFERLAGHQRVALVGVAKNCGKTTTLNALIRAVASRRPLGLVSIGVDGEPQDLLIGTAKPTINVPEGTLIVGATSALEASEVELEYLEPLNVHTPLGPLVVARACSSGTVMLAGVRHRADLIRALERLEAHGASLCLIDGAYGRVMAAHASACDGVVVCTGAVLDRRASVVAARTAALWRVLNLPKIQEGPWCTIAQEATRRRRALLHTVDGQHIELPSASALLGLAQSSALWSEHVDALAIPGLISDRVAESLQAVAALDVPRALLVSDGTHIQLSARASARLFARWDVRALRTVPTLGVSVNPTSIAGYAFDEEVLHEELINALPQDADAWLFNPHKL